MLKVTLGVCAIAIAACGSEKKTEVADASRAPQIVNLSAVGHALTAPDTIDAGWTTFRFANNGDDIHYAHIVRLDSGHSVSQLVKAYAEAIRTSGPRPKWVQRFGGPGGTAPGDTSNVTQNLEPGSYVWICPVEDDAGNPHFGKGEFKEFVVRPTNSTGTAPASSATIRLTNYAFALDSPLKAGRHTIRVVNAASEPHDIGMIKLNPGVTLEDLANMLNPEGARRPGSKPAPSPEQIGAAAGGIATIAPDMEAFFETNLEPGEYVAFCMVTAPDGRSHIEHGMIQQISVK